MLSTADTMASLANNVRTRLVQAIIQGMGQAGVWFLVSRRFGDQPNRDSHKEDS